MPTEIKNDRTPKKDTLKGGKELTKEQTKSCLVCKQSGHTKPMCPLKEPKIQKIAINKKSIEAKSYSDDIRICQAKSERPPCAPTSRCRSGSRGLARSTMDADLPRMIEEPTLFRSIHNQRPKLWHRTRAFRNSLEKRAYGNSLQNSSFLATRWLWREREAGIWEEREESWTERDE
ncbi:hypothetical protein Cgig2_030786 [Carnegiea gigantea]|uniref:Uncharacterized protein n=1 Tax=Carnegiea gigantea TaxID=171969 RepID=A0A9Q1KTR6_9CARY|nr:hypothetical protein Cgig2_030786 [Carnegiea gigantea]